MHAACSSNSSSLTLKWSVYDCGREGERKKRLCLEFPLPSPISAYTLSTENIAFWTVLLETQRSRSPSVVNKICQNMLEHPTALLVLDWDRYCIGLTLVQCTTNWHLLYLYLKRALKGRRHALTFFDKLSFAAEEDLNLSVSWSIMQKVPAMRESWRERERWREGLA